MPKKNTPADLADALFMQIERLDNDELDSEALAAEIERGKAICQLSTQLIANGRLALDVYVAAKDAGDDLSSIPNVLGGHASGPRAVGAARSRRALPPAE